MGALENLSDAVNLNKVLYASLYPIDKITHTGTTSIVNDGATTQAPQTAKITTTTIANPYGAQCYVRFVWSVNGVDFNSAETQLMYTFVFSTIAPAPVTSTTLTGLQGAVSVAVDATNITFLTGNGLHGNVTDNGTVFTYTPTSQTFTIKYALFERIP